MPDSQAGHFCNFELRSFLGSKDEQCDSARQYKSTEDWRNGNSVMFFRCGVDRPDIQNLFLVRVRESLIREGQDSKKIRRIPIQTIGFMRFTFGATFRGTGLG